MALKIWFIRCHKIRQICDFSKHDSSNTWNLWILNVRSNFFSRNQGFVKQLKIPNLIFPVNHFFVKLIKNFLPRFFVTIPLKTCANNWQFRVPIVPSLRAIRCAGVGRATATKSGAGQWSACHFPAPTSAHRIDAGSDFKKLGNINF